MVTLTSLPALRLQHWSWDVAYYGRRRRSVSFPPPASPAGTKNKPPIILADCKMQNTHTLVNYIARLSYYAALIRRRGPHIASHSVCLSVRPVRGSSFVVFVYFFTVEPSYERTSKIEKLLFSLMGQRHVCIFGTHRGPHIVRPSRPHKLV